MCNSVPQSAYAEEQASDHTDAVKDLNAEVSVSPEQDIYVGDEAVLQVEVLQGNGDYRYCFSEKTADDEEIICQDWSESSEYKFQAETPGIYLYFVDVADGAGKTERFEYEVNIKEEISNGSLSAGQSLSIDDNAGNVPNADTYQQQKSDESVDIKGTLSSNRGSQTQLYENRGVTLTANVTQGNGGYEYQYREEYNGETKVVQEYSGAASYTFTTKGVGQHTYYVDIRDAKGKTLTLSSSLTVTAEPVVELQGTLSSNRGSQTQLYENRGVTLTANVTQGNGGYEYQYREKYNGTTKVVQNYSSTASYTFTTKGVGQHTYYVDIRDAKGKSLTLSCSLTVTAAPLVELQGTLSSNRGSQTQLYENRGVTLTANVTQGNGGYEYQYREKYNGTTKVVQNYSSTASYTFTTKGVGQHTYYVDIRDAKGKSLTLSCSLTVTAAPLVELQGTLTSDRGNQTQLYINRGVTLTANVTQGNGGYEYQYRESYNGETKVVQGYSEKAAYAFTTSGVGEHTYYVDIQDAKGKTLTLDFSYLITPHPDNVISGTITSNKGTQVYVNRGITLTVETTNEGYGECQYRFVDYYQGEETVVRDYSLSTVYSFTTEAVGQHIYYVDIRDRENQVVRIPYTMYVVTEEGKEMEVQLECSRTGDVYTDRGVVLTASVSSGYGDYVYQFTQEYNGFRRIVQEYSEDNTYDFKTGMPGKYIYTVTVKDKSQAEASASVTLHVVSDGSIAFGIDVSKWNGDVDWATVKDQGVEFAMIRTGYGTTGSDEQFEKNYSGARNQGIRVGVYHYSYATTEEEARLEAQNVLKILNGRSLELPVAFDIEDPNAHYPLSKEQATKVAIAFCEEIRKAGYTPMVYSMQSFFSTHLDYTKLSSYKIWVARWEAAEPGVDFPVDMWQYSSTASVPGANTSGGVCDVNYAFGL